MTQNYLNSLGDLFHETAQLSGFHPPVQGDIEFLKEFVANEHGEISELWEALRKGQLMKPCDKADKMVDEGLQPLTCLEEELADIVIRALGAARRLNVNIGNAVHQKNLFNRTRPFRHGDKLA